tara:strand:- start:717 stop:977 length:261 start_codon:yes stop_codon:yes gene_type:complete
MNKLSLMSLAALLMVATSASVAQAYVGPGLIIMGNFLGPFLLLIPFLLLLLILALRWWFKKLKYKMMQKKSQPSETKREDSENPDD